MGPRSEGTERLALKASLNIALKPHRQQPCPLWVPSAERVELAIARVGESRICSKLIP
jgi:hypothetical protein